MYQRFMVVLTVVMGAVMIVSAIIMTPAKPATVVFLIGGICLIMAAVLVTVILDACVQLAKQIAELHDALVEQGVPESRLAELPANWIK